MTIEIVDLPIKNGGSFHSLLYVYQRVDAQRKPGRTDRQLLLVGVMHATGTPGVTKPQGCMATWSRLEVFHRRFRCQWVAPPYHSRWRYWRSSYTSYFAVSRRLCTPILTHGRLWLYVYIYTGWWFGTFIFAYTGNNHPNWLIFFRGVETTNQYISLILFCMIAMR